MLVKILEGTTGWLYDPSRGKVPLHLERDEVCLLINRSYDEHILVLINNEEYEFYESDTELYEL